MLSDAEIESRSSENTVGEVLLANALASFRGHVDGSSILGTDALVAATASFEQYADLLRIRETLITQALDLVDAFEASSYGPLFASGAWFSRGPPNQNDGFDTDRALLQVCSVRMRMCSHVN